VQNPGGIGKSYQTNSGFCAGRTTHRCLGNALGLKLQRAPPAIEDCAGCLDIALPAIVAEDSIMADAHQSRREDMQAEAPDELENREG